MHFYVFKMAASIVFVCQNAVEAIPDTKEIQ